MTFTIYSEDAVAYHVYLLMIIDDIDKDVQFCQENLNCIYRPIEMRTFCYFCMHNHGTLNI